MTNRETGCAVNVDDDFVYHVMKGKPITEASLRREFDAFAARYTNKGISDIILNGFGQSSVTPTRVWQSRADIYLRTQEDGIPVDYRENEMLSIPYRIDQLGFDPFAHSFDAFARAGMRTWFSIRMNDCHFGGDPTSWIRSDFYYEAKKNGWLIGPEEYGSYFGNCYNYAVPEVRQKMLHYIEEQLDRYDVYGLELDFSREICCFDFRHDPDCCRTMTEFCRRVKAVAEKAGEKHGHPIRIMLRTARDLLTSRSYGIDMQALARERLIDIAVPAPRFITSDSGMPIDEWLTALSPYGVKVYAGLEAMDLDFMKATPETIKGLAVQFTDLGADKIYLFNAFHYSEWFTGVHDAVWRAAGDVDASRRGTRRHIVTFQDDMLHAVPHPWHPLPKGFVSDTEQEIVTGRIRPQETVTLYLGLQPNSMRPQVLLKGAVLEPVDPDNDAFILNGTRHPAHPDVAQDRRDPKEIRSFRVPASLLGDALKHTFRVCADYGSITYMELKVENRAETEA